MRRRSFIRLSLSSLLIVGCSSTPEKPKPKTEEDMPPIEIQLKQYEACVVTNLGRYEGLKLAPTEIATAIDEGCKAPLDLMQRKMYEYNLERFGDPAALDMKVSLSQQIDRTRSQVRSLIVAQIAEKQLSESKKKKKAKK